MKLTICLTPFKLKVWMSWKPWNINLNIGRLVNYLLDFWLPLLPFLSYFLALFCFLLNQSFDFINSFLFFDWPSIISISSILNSLSILLIPFSLYLACAGFSNSSFFNFLSSFSTLISSFFSCLSSFSRSLFCLFSLSTGDRYIT